MMLRRTILAGLLALGACNTPKPPDTADLSTPPADQRMVDPQTDLRSADLLVQDLLVPDLASVGYPAGPYGYNVGDVVSPMVWEGYVNPTAVGVSTTKTYGPFAMNDLRLSGKKYALVYAADTF